jgi:hypothetical protein
MSEITVPLGTTNLVAYATVLDQNGKPMPSPAFPAWTSINRDVIFPHPAPDGMSAWLEVIGVGDALILVETGVAHVSVIRGQGTVHVIDEPVPTSVALEFSVQ